MEEMSDVTTAMRLAFHCQEETPVLAQHRERRPNVVSAYYSCMLGGTITGLVLSEPIEILHVLLVCSSYVLRSYPNAT